LTITYVPNRNKTRILNTLETEEESSSQFKSVTDEFKEDSKSTERNVVKVSNLNLSHWSFFKMSTLQFYFM
jgi:hypothetical protein